LYSRIKDAQQFEIDNNTYRNVEIKKNTDKFQSVDIKEIETNRKNWNFLMMTEGAWEASQNSHHDVYKLPIELDVIATVFIAYYAQRYRYRNIKYNMSASNADITVTLGGSDYNFHVNMPQMLVLYLLGNRGMMSAKELAETLNIDISKLNLTLTALIMSKIIVREEGPNNNPNMKIRLNDDFKNKESNLDMIEWEKKVDRMMKQKMEKLAAPSQDAANLLKIKTEVLKYFEEKKSFVTPLTLLAELQKRLSFEVSDISLTTVIQKCVSENHLKPDGAMIGPIVVSKKSQQPTK
jgi:DNA-binding MarR family transcriptional regulator